MLRPRGGGRDRPAGEIRGLPGDRVGGGVPAQRHLEDLRPEQPRRRRDLPREAERGPLQGHPPPRRQRLRRRRGRELLPAQRRGLFRHRSRDREGRPFRRIRARSEHDHPADGQVPLPHPGKEHRAQAEGDDPRLPDREETHQGGDPLPLPEPDLPRGWGVRRRGGGADLLLEGGLHAHRRGRGAPRGAGPGAHPLLAAGPHRQGEGPAAVRAAPDGGGRVPRQGRRGEGVRGAPGPGAPLHLPVESRVLPRGRPQLPPGEVRPGCDVPQRVQDLHDDRREAAGGGVRRRDAGRSPDGGGEQVQGAPGSAAVHGPRHGRDSGDGGRRRLRRVAVQPGASGEAAAGLRLQADRLRRRPRQGEDAGLHGRRLADRVLEKRDGDVETEELRRYVPRPHPAARGAGQVPQPGDRPAAERDRRGHGDPDGAGPRHPVAHRAEPLHRPRVVRGDAPRDGHRVLDLRRRRAAADSFLHPGGAGRAGTACWSGPSRRSCRRSPRRPPTSRSG